MVYANLENLIADYLPDSVTTAEQAAVARLIESASRAIDRFCGRADDYFAAATEESETRKIYGNGETFLLLPPFVSRSVSPTITAPSGVTVPRFVEFGAPLNRGLQITDERGCLVPEFLCSDVWEQGAPFSVSARWGFNATPADVTEACRQIVVRWHEAQRGVLGQVSPNGFVIERDFPPSARAMLTPYISKKDDLEQRAQTGRIGNTDFVPYGFDSDYSGFYY